MRGPHRVRELFVTADVLDRQDDFARAVVAADVPVTVVTDRVARSLSETVHPQGAVAVVDIPQLTLDAALSTGHRLVVVLDGVADPGNAGTVIRTAAAAGADAVVFCRDSVDPYGAKCVRATAGSILHVPIVTGVDLATTVAELHDRGLQLLATALDGDDLFSLEEDLQRPTGWLFGGEAHGLSAAAAGAADRTVRIPMTDRVESLNLAAAAAICLYASARAQVAATLGTGTAGTGTAGTGTPGTAAGS